MGIERKNPRLNWIGSFGLIILAGTLYRLGKVNKKVMQTQISDILEKMGGRLYGNKAVEFKKVFPSEQARTPQENAEMYRAKYEMKTINSVKKKISKYL